MSVKLKFARKGTHFVEVDLDDPFFRELHVDIATPVDFARIGLFVGVQYDFEADSEWAGERLSYQIPAQVTTDRTLKVDPADDLGFLELAVFPNRIDAGIVDAIDVDLSYSDGATFQRHDFLRVMPGGGRQFWRLRLTRPDRREWTAQFTHHLKNGTTRTSLPITSDASFLAVNDPFLAALDIRVIPLFAPGTVARAFVDVHYTDTDNNYQREERIELPGNATEPVALRIALLNPALRIFRHRISIVTADGGLIQRAPVDGEETLIGVGL